MLRSVEVRSSPRVLGLQRPRASGPTTVVVGLFFAGGAVLGSLRSRQFLLVLATIGAVVLLSVLGAALAWVNARLLISSETVAYRTVFRRTRTCARRDVRRLMSVRLSTMGHFSVVRTLLLDERNRAMLSLRTELWKAEDWTRIEGALAVPFGEARSAISCDEANRRYPGAASFFLGHQFWIYSAVLAVAVIVALGIIGTISSTPR